MFRKCSRILQKTMVQFSFMKPLFGKMNDNYKICNNNVQNQKIGRKKIIRTSGFILLILIICIIILISTFCGNQKKSTYNRSKDPNLYKYIRSSKAASNLPKQGKLFCWVQTSPVYHDTRALAINETWIHRCDHGQLFTSDIFNNSKIPYTTVFSGIPDNYYNLFFKSRYAFYYIYKYISRDFDWYLKADDDTYVVVENLRSYLNNFDPNEPHYLGYTLKPYLKNGYNAGGAGYVLSRAAMKIFAEKLYNDPIACPDDIYEDVGIARCLESVGIYPRDTRNEKGQNRFNTFSPYTLLHEGSNIDWIKYNENQGFEAFAEDLVSFHKLTPDEIRLFDILLYRTKISAS